MNGCRALSNDEYVKLLEIADPMERCLLSLGVRTGFRISELLRILWPQLINSDGTMRDSVEIPKRNVKGKTESRRILLHEECKRFIVNYKAALQSSQWIESRVFPIGKRAAYNRLKKLYGKANIKEGDGTLATHTMRQTFSDKMQEQLEIIERNPIKALSLLQQLMGHKNAATTMRYVKADQTKILEAIKNAK